MGDGMAPMMSAPSVVERGRHLAERPPVDLRVPDDPPSPGRLGPPGLELGLDQHDDRRPRRPPPRRPDRHGPGHRDERQVGGDQVDRRSAHGVQGDLPDVQALAADHPGIVPQAGMELARPDVDGHHRAAPAWSRQSVNPPVEAPASRARRPAASRPNRSRAARASRRRGSRSAAAARGARWARPGRPAGRLVGHGAGHQHRPRSIRATACGRLVDQPPLDQGPVEAPSGRVASVGRPVGSRASRPDSSWPVLFLAGGLLRRGLLGRGLLGRGLLGRPPSWPEPSWPGLLGCRLLGGGLGARRRRLDRRRPSVRAGRRPAWPGPRAW